jgi:hypothetical protein
MVLQRETSPPFCFFDQARMRSPAQRPKPAKSNTTPPEAGGETRNRSFPQQFNALSA